jgi:hypothetical protein
MKPEFSSYSLRLAGYLMYKGFVLKLMRDDQKSRRKIFIFNDSPELQIAIQDYLYVSKNN